MQVIEIGALETVSGGADQAQLRTLAQKYCPATYNQFKGAKTITRPMAEQCLDQAGYGAFKGQLDQYFPKTK